MKAKALTLAVGLAVTVAAGAVELVRDGDKWTVANGIYKAQFDAKKNGELTHITYKGAGFRVSGSFVCEYDGQHEKWCGRVTDVRATADQRTLPTGTAKVVAESKESVVLEFAWTLPDGCKAVQTLSFDDTAAVRIRQRLDWKRRMGHAYYRAWALPCSAKKTVFYPESRECFATYNNGNFSKFPRWKGLSDGRASFALAALPDQGWNKFKFALSTTTKSGHIELYHDYLDHAPVPGSLDTTFALILAPNADALHAAAVAALGNAKPVELTDIEPDKVFSVKGTGNGLVSTLVNNTAEARDVRVVTELVTGLADVRKVGEETVSLKPWEKRVYRKQWTYPADVDWGVAMRLAAYDAKTEALLDKKSDVTSVSDRAFAASGCGILNAGQVNREEDNCAWVATLKRQYMGMVEYYCWAPSTWDPDRKAGLAPLADSWRPETEASGYDTPLTKKMVKGFVDECHANGIHVYSWLTGLVNYRHAFAHPEYFQYGPDGQLTIYNGTIDKKTGKRVATAKLAPYTLEAAREWGEQMADSVDMFGWDGCRWDWGWVPSMPNDPRFADELLKNPKMFEWFDYQGRSCYELYKDPDGLAAELLHEWRATVNKRHPKFFHTSNMHTSKEIFESTPKYMKETSTNALALNEYLLNFTTGYPTFDRWSEALVGDTSRVRPNGSHIEVGFMRGLCDESAALHLARLVCHAAGTKWWGGPNEFRYYGANHRSVPYSIRFSEYFFGLDFMCVEAEGKVKVMKDDVLWKRFVFERTKNGVREVLVHVVNVKPDGYINELRPDPKPVANLVAEAYPAAGEKLAEAWALLPGDEPTAVKLAVSGNRATLPEMQEAASFVFRFAKQGKGE